MQCPDCGAYIGEEDRFCGECGRPIDIAPAVGSDTGPEAADAPARTITAPQQVERPEYRPPPSPVTAAAPVRRRGLFIGLIATWAAMVVVCMAGGIIFLALRSERDKAPTAAPAAVKYAPGTVAYAEEFDTDDGGWDVYDDQDTWAAYVDGGYHLGVRVPEYVTWANPTWDESFANIEIEVDTRQVEGPIDNNLGVLVRYQADDESYYWFQISNDGFYSVTMLRGGDWETLLEWTTSDAIETGLGVVNRIKVVCYGDEFDFYVNDTYLASIVDDTFATGNIGLAAGTFDEPGVVIEFDNLTVRALEE